MHNTDILDYVIDEEFEDENDGESYKLRRYEITSYVTQKSVESLLKWVNSDKIIIPDFQRDYVWKMNSASKFIDSVLLGLPIPNIFLYKIIDNGVEKFYVVDGFQRVQTLKYFKDGVWKEKSDLRGENSKVEFNSKIFKLSLKSSEWYGKNYSSLSDDDKFNFDEYSINMTVFEQSEPNNKNSMYDVFERINTGSDKLSSQEIRNAVYIGDFLKTIRKEVESKQFILLTNKDSNISTRERKPELYLRLVSYYYAYKNNFMLGEKKVTSSKRDTLNNTCDYFNKFGNYESYIRDINCALETICSFSENAFYAKKRNTAEIGKKVSEVFAEALVIAVIQNNFKIDCTEQQLQDYKVEHWDTSEFYSVFIEQSTTIKNIKDRVDIILKVISGESN